MTRQVDAERGARIHASVWPSKQWVRCLVSGVRGWQHCAVLFLTCYAAWLGGCGIVRIKSASAGNETAVSKQRPGRYDGPECYEVLYTPDESRTQNQRHQDESPEAQVLLATCTRSAYRGSEQKPKISSIRFRDLYSSYDDRKPDPVRLAVMASNERFNEQRLLRLEQQSRGFDKEAFEEVLDALISLMLQDVSEGQLSQALASVNVPDEAKQALVADFLEAKTFFAQEADTLEGPKRELLIDTPEQVLERRRRQFEVQAANWRAFDGLAERLKMSQSMEGGDPELRKELEALRPKVVEVAEGDYIEDPLFARLTREIALQYALAQDPASLAAERQIYRRGIYSTNPFPETFAQEVHYAQLGLISEFRQAQEQFRKAKEAGLDEAAARARAGRDFIDFNPSKLISVEPEMPSYEKLLDKKVDAFSFTEIVESITPRNDGVLVAFKKTPVETWEYYGCYDTGRIERITSDGRLKYEKHCNTRKKMVMHENQTPLKFLPEEAKLLKRGITVRGMSVGSKGRIVWLIVKDKIVLERGYPVPPRPAYSKQKN